MKEAMDRTLIDRCKAGGAELRAEHRALLRRGGRSPESPVPG